MRPFLPLDGNPQHAMRGAACAALFGALLLGACDDFRAPGAGDLPAAPMAPAPDDEIAGTQSAFYPLDLGNEWHYDRQMVIRHFPPGSPDPSVTEEFHFEEDRVLDQTEELFGRTYVVESRTIVQDFPLPDVSYEWVRYRQDHSGLYEADVSINDPPGPAKVSAIEETPWEPSLPVGLDPSAFGAEAIEHPASFREALVELEGRRLRLRGALSGERVAVPSSVLPDEITRLEYPLHVGATFAIREGFLDARVEAYEPLATPAGTLPAWRIRLLWGTPEASDDTIFMWFSRCGNLKLYFQGEVVITAPDGTVLGTMQMEEVQVVEELHAEGRPCGQRRTRQALD